MRWRAGVLAAALMLPGAGVCGAQEVVEPDRPDVTNGAHIVGVGLLQIEFGGLFTRTIAAQSSFGSPFTARVGLTKWLEARVGTDGVLTQADDNGRVTGFGNVQVGAKLRLWGDPDGVALLSILPNINVPTASAEKGLGSGQADYTIAVLTGADLGHHVHADVNYGIGAIGSGDNRPRFAQHLASISVSDAISGNWNPYVEAFWYSRQDVAGRGVTSIDAGAIYQIGTRYAVDGGVQFGVTANAPRFAAFGGLSMIVGHLLGQHGAVARQPAAQARAARLWSTK